MAESSISTRLLEVISNRCAGQGKKSIMASLCLVGLSLVWVYLIKARG